MMLTELCQELRNWFEIKKHFGVFKIEGGQLANCSFLQDGQYYRIVGSVFNDGVYQWPDSDLQDESFDGAIWAMAVPPTVVALSDKIEEWNDMYAGVGGQLLSPFQSESFGGYSYSKGSSRSGGSTSIETWRSVFADELNRWRKI